ncbi:GntR family transcriptional regulator [Shimia sp.]|uniref:GntR family transcriptional regulator n=1 Tax=Shimia sp. TaxID=1954381 RepID=UPI003297D6DA
MTQIQRPVGVSDASAKDVYRSRTRSASDACADYLRSQIVSGEIEDGAPIVIDRVADSLGASHTPVREAIRRLEAEGLVKYVPNRGARVRGLSRPEFEELVELRVATEPLALGRAIKNAVPGDFMSADFEFQEWQKGVGSQEMLAQQWAFFKSMYEPSGLVRTLEVIDANWRLIERYHKFAWTTSEEVRETDYRLKLAILKSSRARDQDAAKAALVDAIEWGASLVRKKLS